MIAIVASRARSDSKLKVRRIFLSDDILVAILNLFLINGKLIGNNDRSEAFPPKRRSRKTAINHVLDLENRFDRFRGVSKDDEEKFKRLT